MLDPLLIAQPVAAFVGLVVLLLAESAHPFFDLFRERRERGAHLLRNLALGAFNALIVAVVFAGLWVAAATWADANDIGLLHWLAWPTWLHALGALLLLDAWTYVWHRLNHRIPVLWRFHRVHHADAEMDVTTASRFHIGELVLSSALRIPLIVGLGIFAWELVLYETLMFAVVQFHHANVMLPARLDRALRAVIVTPAMHKVHHSRLQPETDSNYSALFSWWDRLFRSFRLRARPEEIHFGLDAFDTPEDSTLRGLLAMPFNRPARPDHNTDPSVSSRD
ncbi:MAG: sterol desaturase family protein [Rhodothermaceae bacterium]|nr:sterol desaturase family protein [Rhodothermaceae bacterium]